MNEHENIKIYNPRNVMQSKRILGFKSRNWIEAGIAFILTALVVWQIPFVFRVKLIVTVCIGGSLAFLNLIGIRNQSFSETAISFFIFLQNRKTYSLRSVNHAKNNYYDENTGEVRAVGVSIADKGILFIKNKIKTFNSQNR